MKIKFEKYESGGNDFVLIDNRNNLYDLNSDKIKKICTRNFGQMQKRGAISFS